MYLTSITPQNRDPFSCSFCLSFRSSFSAKYQLKNTSRFTMFLLAFSVSASSLLLSSTALLKHRTPRFNSPLLYCLSSFVSTLSSFLTLTFFTFFVLDDLRSENEPFLPFLTGVPDSPSMWFFFEPLRENKPTCAFFFLTATHSLQQHLNTLLS